MLRQRQGHDQGCVCCMTNIDWGGGAFGFEGDRRGGVTKFKLIRGCIGDAMNVFLCFFAFEQNN